MAASLTSTTFAAAVAVNDTVVKLASVTYAVKGNVLFANGEAMLVVADPVGTTVQVRRGYGATFAQAHASGALVWANPPDAYSNVEPAGSGSTSTELYLPRIVLRTQSIFTLVNSLWTKLVDKGIALALPGQSVQAYTAAGALQLVGGTHNLGTSGALAMTLAEPDGNTPEGTIMIIRATTAQAHTVTYTSGFRGDTTSGDVATFGGAINDKLIIQNIGGYWRVIDLLNITIA
jgi:hypothetical protein